MPINNHAASIASSDASSSRPIPVRFNAQETFAALDAENGGAAPVWIHTGGIKAEAGFKDPTLGWVGVRAQVDAGGVHAAVVPSSAGASQALSGNMTNLSTYLTEHHSPVQTLTMASPESFWGKEIQNILEVQTRDTEMVKRVIKARNARGEATPLLFLSELKRNWAKAATRLTRCWSTAGPKANTFR